MKKQQHSILVCTRRLGNLSFRIYDWNSASDPGLWYAGMANIGLDMNVVYNIGDAINKIGFGLVVYAAAVKETK